MTFSQVRGLLARIGSYIWHRPFLVGLMMVAPFEILMMLLMVPHADMRVFYVLIAFRLFVIGVCVSALHWKMLAQADEIVSLSAQDDPVDEVGNRLIRDYFELVSDQLIEAARGFKTRTAAGADAIGHVMSLLDSGRIDPDRFSLETRADLKKMFELCDPRTHYGHWLYAAEGKRYFRSFMILDLVRLLVTDGKWRIDDDVLLPWQRRLAADAMSFELVRVKKAYDDLAEEMSRRTRESEFENAQRLVDARVASTPSN